MRYIIIFLLFFFNIINAFAQDVSFKVKAPGVVEVGENFQLVYELNTKGENLRVPTFSNFSLLAGPSTSFKSQTSIDNGKATSYQIYSYTYLLSSDTEGEYTIEPATITVKGKEYKSDPIKIKVVKGTGNSQNNTNRGNNRNNNQNNQRTQSSTSISNDDLFLRLEVSRNNLYVGESLVATLKVYSRVSLSNFDRAKFPEYNGFLSEEIEIPRIELNREDYNGKVYEVGVLKRTILSPQHSGTITIDPFELDCIINQRVSGGGFFDDFFGNSRQIRVTRKTNPVNITVKKLPDEGKPLGFSGTVGNINMTTTISQDTLRANDAFTYTVTFSGTGNLKVLGAPKITFPHDFEVYDPKINRNIRTIESGNTGNVTYEYLVIPRFGGDFTIPAIQYSVFDPSTQKYKTLSGKEYSIHVLKGNESSAASGDNAVQSFKKEDVRMLGEEIRFIKTNNKKLHPKGVTFYNTLIFWMCYLIPFVLLVLGLLINRRRIEANADLVRVKSKSANKMAQKRLKLANQAMKSKNSELFYQEVLSALWGYVSYKLNISASDLNRDNINEHLVNRGVDSQLIQNFIDILDHCEFARYAPGADKNEEMEKVYNESINVITKLDKAI